MTPKSKEELAEEYTNTDYFRLEYSTFGTTAKECQKAFLAGFQKSEEMNFQNENLELSEKFFQEKTNELQSRVKELSEENERLKLAASHLLETMDFLQRNHNVMNIHAHAKLAIEKFDKALSGKDGVDETV